MKKKTIVTMTALFLCGLQWASADITNIWTGAFSSDLNTAGNWSFNAVPTTDDTLAWDGTQSGDLSLTASAGFYYVDYMFKSTQTGSVTIDGNGNTFTSTITTPSMNIESGAGAVTFDNMNYQLGNIGTGNYNFYFFNNSTNTMTFGTALTFTRVGVIAVSGGQRNMFFDVGAFHVLGTINNVGNSSYLRVRNSGTSLILDGAVGLRVLVQSGAALGGAGTLARSLDFASGTKLIFDAAATLTVNDGVTFGGFSVADLVDLDSSVADGTYTLIDGTIDFSNVSNVGETNAYSLGDGKTAYFEDGVSALKLIVAGAGYAGWASEWGVDIGAETNDYDSDGLLNIYEYGLGGNPTNAGDQGTSPEFSLMTVGGSNKFSYVHPQLSDSESGLAYSLETCTDLVDGAWTNAGDTVVGTNVTGGALDFVTNTIGTTEGQKFIRLIIE